MVKAAAMRKRYVLFESSGQIREEELKRGLGAEALKFFGEIGMSYAGFKLLEYDIATRQGVIRCERSYLEKVLGFLALISSLSGVPMRIRSLRSSGTIEGLKNP